jgi:hypothetical protein
MQEPAKAHDRHVSFRGPPFFRPPGEEGAACSKTDVRERRSTVTKSNGHSVVPGNCRQESLNEGGRRGGEYMYGADKPQMKKGKENYHPERNRRLYAAVSGVCFAKDLRKRRSQATVLLPGIVQMKPEIIRAMASIVGVLARV